MRIALALIIVTMVSMGIANAAPQKKPVPRVAVKKPPTKKPLPKKPVKKPSLRGSKAVAKKQNSQADKERLTRIADAAQLKRFIERGILVPLPENIGIRIDPRLGKENRYCRPWTRRFLQDFGRAYALQFQGDHIQINSAVRTLAQQRALRLTNSNAAPLKGETASSHPTAATVDIAKGGSTAKNEWIRDYLRQKKSAGQITVAEEFLQPVFHVMVFQNYGVKKKTSVTAVKAQPKTKAPVRKSAFR